MTLAAGRVASLYRYPVKGLSPEQLDVVDLEKGGTFPWDRAFALENGSQDFDPAHPKHFPKIKFLMLMRHEALAALQTRFDDPTGTLHIAKDGAPLLSVDITTAQGKKALEDFMSQFMDGKLRGAPHLAHAAGFSHSDCPAKLVSIINLASVAELESKIGRAVDPLRFRANIYVEGLDPWEDHEWEGLAFNIGKVRLRGYVPTERCAATNVNPVTAARDMEIPKTLLQTYGHTNLGLYAHVISPGTIRPGDLLSD
ncbi:MAG: MOSC domain-containing protein [Rhizobiales bacterium]|nr:MOSC domain-containing protein [Hyphomicrobiales bacterium]